MHSYRHGRLHSKGFLTLLSHTIHAGNSSKHNAWKALSIVLASAGHNTAAPSIIASYSKLCEQADALRHRPLKIPLHAGGAW